jgi:ECF transporter S component (folate family)
MNLHNQFVTSAAKLRQTRYLALMAAMIALKVVCGFFYIPVGENLHLSFSFLLVGLEAMIIGPAAGMVSGAVTDIVGFMIHPDGPWFPGYTLTAMAGELVYGLFFYGEKVTWTRISLAKIATNYGINVLMGSLWSAILYSKGYFYYLTKSLIKNSIYLPFQILMFGALFALLGPVLQKRGLIPGSIALSARKKE